MSHPNFCFAFFFFKVFFKIYFSSSFALWFFLNVFSLDVSFLMNIDRCDDLLVFPFFIYLTCVVYLYSVHDRRLLL